MSDTSADEPGGFHHFIKNPAWRREMEEAARQQQSSGKPVLDEDSIREMIEQFIQGNFDRDAKTALQDAGQEVIPHLLEALRDSRLTTARYKNTTHALDDSLPLTTIIDLLRPCPPAEAIPLLARFLSHPDPGFRNNPAYSLGSTGADYAIAPLARALDDKDDYVRSYALMGMRDAVDAGRTTDAFKEAMFPRVERVLSIPEVRMSRVRRWCWDTLWRLRRWVGMPAYEYTDGNFNTAEKAPLLLLQMDSQKGLASLLQPRHLHPDHPYLYRILGALNEKQLGVPDEKLRSLLASLRSRAADYFAARACGEVLYLLARSDCADAEALIRDAATWDSEEIREAAAIALNMLAGITDPTGFVLRRLEKFGSKRLSRAQKAYYCVWVLDCEVCNGGFAQYFVNSAGNLAHLTRKALKAIGAPETEQLLAQAMALFGEAGPERNRDKRHEQLAKLFDASKAKLDELDTLYYKDPDSLKVRLQEFARRYKKHFSKRSKSTSGE